MYEEEFKEVMYGFGKNESTMITNRYFLSRSLSGINNKYAHNYSIYSHIEIAFISLSNPICTSHVTCMAYIYTSIATASTYSRLVHSVVALHVVAYKPKNEQKLLPFHLVYTIIIWG